MFQCSYCNYQSLHKYNVQRHETAIHGSNQHKGTASTTCESMQRNQIGGSVLTNSHQEQMFQSEQQRVPIKYYQNIKNQLDHPSSSYIQWQDSYKKELRRMKIFETQAELSKETIAKLLNML